MAQTSYWKAFFLISSIVSISGCSLWATEKADDFSYLKGKHILTVIERINRNPDVIEDWSDYKRYTWQYCKPTGQTLMAAREDGSYYIKPEQSCCALVFEANRSNKIMAYQGVENCPLGDSLKLTPKKE